MEALTLAQIGFGPWGANLARNFNPLVASAARVTIVEADEIVEIGDIDPHDVHSPGIFTNHLFQTKDVPEDSWQDWRKSA